MIILQGLAGTTPATSATVDQIEHNPGQFLGINGTEEQYRAFLDAVGRLMEEGLSEADAVAVVYNHGDWEAAVEAIQEYGWRPTHVIKFANQRLCVQRDEYLFFTIGQWAHCFLAAFELDGDGNVLYYGEKPWFDVSVEAL